MELGLSLGDSPAPAKGTFTLVLTPTQPGHGEDHELVLELGVGTAKKAEEDNQKTPMQPEDMQEEDDEARSHSKSPVKLSLGCPLLPAFAETGTVNSEVCRLGFDVNNVPVDGDVAKARSLSTSSLQVDVPVRQAADQEAGEDEENCGGSGGARKKLRLSKEQSAFLEDSFKEHSTLTPKQKSDLAKRLNLRPRQVEVWFQNRRARTKLKQTEVDCEYLKRCCETLTQENQRLQREVAELRAYRTTYPFYSHYLGSAPPEFAHHVIIRPQLTPPLSPPSHHRRRLHSRCLPCSPGLTSGPSPSTWCSAASHPRPRDA